MKSSTGKQIIAIHIFSNISRSKGNQRTKFGQLIEYCLKKKYGENEAGRLVTVVTVISQLLIFNMF